MLDINRVKREMKIRQYVERHFQRNGHILKQEALTWKCQNCDAKIIVDTEDLDTMDISWCIISPCGDPKVSCKDMKREKIGRI
jgi:hypothetical protein